MKLVGGNEIFAQTVVSVQINAWSTPSIFLDIKSFSKYFHNKCTQSQHALRREKGMIKCMSLCS